MEDDSLIGTLQVNLSFPGLSRADQAIPEAERLTGEAVVPALEKVVREYGFRPVLLDSLEIDLGPVTEEELPSALERALRNELDRRIGPVFRPVLPDDAPITIEVDASAAPVGDAPASPVDGLLAYLTKLQIPWDEDPRTFDPVVLYERALSAMAVAGDSGAAAPMAGPVSGSVPGPDAGPVSPPSPEAGSRSIPASVFELDSASFPETVPEAGSASIPPSVLDAFVSQLSPLSFHRLAELARRSERFPEVAEWVDERAADPIPALPQGLPQEAATTAALVRRMALREASWNAYVQAVASSEKPSALEGLLPAGAQPSIPPETSPETSPGEPPPATPASPGVSSASPEMERRTRPSKAGGTSVSSGQEEGLGDGGQAVSSADNPPVTLTGTGEFSKQEEASGSPSPVTSDEAVLREAVSRPAPVEPPSAQDSPAMDIPGVSWTEADSGTSSPSDAIWEITPEEAEPVGERIFISDAGLVLVHPFIRRFFRSLDLVDEKGRFVSGMARIRAVHLLRHVTGYEGPHRAHCLSLEKVLCGLPVNYFVPEEWEVTPRETEETKGMLSALLSYWPSLRKSSIGALQQSFLQRAGTIGMEDGQVTIRVEGSAIDILMEDLPWENSIILLPWLEKPILVEWQK